MEPIPSGEILTDDLRPTIRLCPHVPRPPAAKCLGRACAAFTPGPFLFHLPGVRVLEIEGIDVVGPRGVLAHGGKPRVHHDPVPLVRIVPGALASFRPAYAVAAASTTFFTIGVEVGLPFLVWTRLRPYVVVFGFLLHTGIAIFMGLTLFSLLMMTMLLGYLPGATFRERLFSTAAVKTKVPFDPKVPESVAAAARAVAWDTKGAVEPVATG